MISSLFSSDKAPFIVSLSLAAISWFISTIVTNLSDVIVLGKGTVTSKDAITFSVTNHSIKRSFDRGILSFHCRTTNCLAPISKGSHSFVKDDPIIPYAIQGYRVCEEVSWNVTTLVTLPPGASMRYQFHLSTNDTIDFLFLGFLATNEDPCPSSNDRLGSDNVWILPDPSLPVFIVGYYFYILVTCLAITLIFLVGLILFGKTQPQLDT